MKPGPKPKTREQRLATRGSTRTLPSALPNLPPLGGPPDDWTDEQIALWYEVIESVPPQVLTSCDRLLVELAARLLARVRSEDVINSALATQFRMVLGELGCTPAARLQMAIGAGPRADNPFLNNGRFFR